MTTNTVMRCLEEAVELGDRFPDLPEFDVLQHVSDVLNLSDSLANHPDWALSRCVMASYENVSLYDGFKTAKAWKIVSKDTKLGPYEIYLD